MTRVWLTLVSHPVEQKKTLNGKEPSEALAKRKSFQFHKDSWLHPAAQSDNVFKATEEIHLPLLPEILRGNWGMWRKKRIRLALRNVSNFPDRSGNNICQTRVSLWAGMLIIRYLFPPISPAHSTFLLQEKKGKKGEEEGESVTAQKASCLEGGGCPLFLSPLSLLWACPWSLSPFWAFRRIFRLCPVFEQQSLLFRIN